MTIATLNKASNSGRDSDYSISVIYNILYVQDASAAATNARDTLDPRNS
jgi:hypothetical protein